VVADALDLKSIPIDTGTAFRFYPRPAYVSGSILRPDGSEVADIAKDSQLDERERALPWMDSGAQHPKGAYRLELTVMATHSSQDRIAKVVTLDFDYGGVLRKVAVPALG
jgi:hypothetical protein